MIPGIPNNDGLLEENLGAFEKGKREKIGLLDTGMDILLKMSEGNPGAATVLAELLKKDGTDGFFAILGLDDMNIRGSQVWVGYKDHCGMDMDRFLKAIKDRDADMVERTNEACAMTAEDEKAVTSGASVKRD